MIKSYTDLEQSKKLAKILPLETADYCWGIDDETLQYNNSPYPCAWKDYTCKEYYIPCWSLVALLNALDFSTINLHYDNTRTDWVASATIHDSTKHCTKYESTRALNPVDACVDMIIKFHELEIL